MSSSSPPIVPSCRSVLIIATWIVSLTLTACTPKLWEDANSPAELEIEQTPQAIGSQIVKFDVETLKKDGEISLTLPGVEQAIFIVRKDLETIAEARFVWRGKIKGDLGSAVTLSVVEGRLVGDISTSDGRIFSIRYVSKGVALVEELDATKIPREEAHGRHEGRLPGGTDVGLVVDRGLIRGQARVLAPEHDVSGSVPEVIESAPEEIQSATAQAISYIDLLVLYTAAASRFQNDPLAMESKIQQAIFQTNDSYENSRVNQEVRLAFSKQTTYLESGAIDLDWANLLERSLTKIPAFTEVDNLISTHKADIVVLLTKPALESESCGMASQMHKKRPSFCSAAVAVVPVTCATATYSFAHELGHIMGADHNDAGGRLRPPFDFSRGYVPANNKWHTIMAYPTGDCVSPACQRISYWSSSDPGVAFAEKDLAVQADPVPEPTGDASADNAKALNETASTVAQFSDTCVSAQGSYTGGNQ